MKLGRIGHPLLSVSEVALFSSPTLELVCSVRTQFNLEV